jgi:hypothetical protein
MQFYDLLPLGQVHIFPRQVVIKQLRFANDILHKTSIKDKVSLQATTVCRQPQSERKSKDCANVHGKRTICRQGHPNAT